MDNNHFTELSRINVSAHIEKKAGFSYLSWPYAVSQLRQADPLAIWEVKRFDGLPFLKTECGYFVEVAVTVQGITLSQIHPVLDSKNRPIGEPNAFEINTSIQRCLVKAIALHGLGLYVYAGEDLPEGEPPADPTPANDPAPATAPATAARATAAQLRYLERLVAQTGTPPRKILDFFGAEQLADLSMTQASRAIKTLENNRRAA